MVGDSASGADVLSADRRPAHAGWSCTPFLLTAKQTAEFLGVTLQQVRNMNNSGRIPNALRLGNQRRWRVVELELWRERNYPTRQQWTADRDGQWRPYRWPWGNQPFPPDNDARGEGAPWLIPRYPFGRRPRSQAPQQPGLPATSVGDTSSTSG